MKKVIIAIVAVVLVVAGGAYLIVQHKSGSNKSGSASTANQLPTANLTASDVLTKDVAESLLGTDIQKKDSPADSSTDNITTTITSYIPNVDPSKGLAKIGAVQLVARIAKTKDAAKANIEAFNGKPTGAQDVTGIGDKAFYTPDFKQLDVLKGGNWYVVTYYEDFFSQKASLDTDKQLAEKLQFK